MNLDAFEASVLGGGEPPSGLSAPLLALWWDRRGGWERAHGLVAEDEGREAAWVHAYLHRREGDAGNAAYWYRRAGRPSSGADLASEWNDIARTLLEAGRTP